MEISEFVKLILVTCAILSLIFPALAGLNFEPKLWPAAKELSMGQKGQIETMSTVQSTGYNSPPRIPMKNEHTSTKYNHISETSTKDEGPSALYNIPWDSSGVKLDSYGHLTTDDIKGLMGADYDLHASNMDVLTRGMLYGGDSYIIVANPQNVPIKVIVNPQISNWNMQYVQIKYGNLLVAKLGNQMRITVPGSQSGLIIINTPPRKRYSFTASPKPPYSFSAGPKPSNSFRAGPKPPYSFRAGPKPPYSFRIGY